VNKTSEKCKFVPEMMKCFLSSSPYNAHFWKKEGLNSILYLKLNIEPKLDQDSVVRYEEDGRFPRLAQVIGEIKIPFPRNNPILDLNYTKAKCSFKLIFPLQPSENFHCNMKSKLGTFTPKPAT